MRQILNARTVAIFVTGVLFTFVLDKLSNLVSESNNLVMMVFIMVALLIFGAIAMYYQTRPQRTTIIDRTPLVLRDRQDWQQYAHKGMIVFISLYNPFKSPTAKGLSVEQWLTAAQDEDYEKVEELFEPIIVIYRPDWIVF